MTNYKPVLKLYSKNSERVYLNIAERKAFKQAAMRQNDQIKFLCLILLYTGCRITEALNLRVCDLHFDQKIIAITSIKKREKHHVRLLHISTKLTRQLKQFCKGKHQLYRPFAMHRTTAWRRIKKIMSSVGIKGEHATLKALRHSFGVACAFEDISIKLYQEWLGHSSVELTLSYTRIVGKDARSMASRLWK